MKTYEIRHRESNRKGYIAAVKWSSRPLYRCGEYKSLYEYQSDDYSTLAEASREWAIPKSVQIKLAIRAHCKTALKIVAYTLIGLVLSALVGGLFVSVCCTWDYHTGQDTGYISAVDKMTFSDDRTIYVRRRPLDAQGYTTAEADETSYCTTADRQEVIDKAYEAMTNGKRVILVYDTPRPFGWRAIGYCNEAPITEIKYVEE